MATGAPPEVHSLAGPVRSASVQWMTADMKARGRDLGAAFIKQLTSATEADLRTRLRQGGHNMPSFAQISDQEYAVLRPYLDELAGLPAGEAGTALDHGACRSGRRTGGQGHVPHLPRRDAGD